MRVVILGSGRGSNAQAILQAEKNGQLGSAQIVAIISDQADAGILQLGSQYQCPAQYLDPGPWRTKLDGAGQDRYIETIDQHQADLIVLAGFMRVIKEPFLQHFSGKVINLHPSLLPKFPGLDAIGQAFRSGDSHTGCTVHYVTPTIDAGPIIAQATVAIDAQDSEESLAHKVHQAEHQLLPQVIQQLSQTPV